MLFSAPVDNTSHTDSIIFGAGPAGLAAAIALRQHGRSVTVLSWAQKFHGSGESLAATARQSLIRLGLWDSFQQDAHPPCYANSSAWGGDTLQHYNFIQSANGYGWHIDRSLFDRRLLEKAQALGVPVVEGKRHTARQAADGSWQVESDALPAPLQARLAIDATGRNSWLARQLGVARLKSDEQIALVAFLSTSGPGMRDHSSLVESVPEGWWYSALQPDGGLACIFFTDPDLHDNRDLCLQAHWNRLAQESRHTWARIAAHGYALRGSPFFRAANSSILSDPVGNNWLAVGDAAMSYDPLSAHGLSLALATGWDAAQAVHGHIEGRPYLLEHYGMLLRKAFLAYAGERFGYYGLERRWEGAPYWDRRRDKGRHLGLLEQVVAGTVAPSTTPR